MEQFGVTPLWNVPYSPEFNGIEKVWGVLKTRFRKRLSQMKVEGKKFDLEVEVKKLISGIKNKMLKNYAAHGFAVLEKGGEDYYKTE